MIKIIIEKCLFLEVSFVNYFIFRSDVYICV